MATPIRIDWPSAMTSGAEYCPVILIAGVPLVIVPGSRNPTSTQVTAGTPDPRWWPGVGTLTQSLPGAITFDPVRRWLDPSAVFEMRATTRILEGDTKVEALEFELIDLATISLPGGEVTAEISVRDARVAEFLGADIPATGNIPLVSTASAPASGIAAIGRETIVYNGTGGGSLIIGAPPEGRGKYGSKARTHLSPVVHRPLVVFGGARHWQGRQASLWVCRVVGDALEDPTLMYLGQVGAGVQLNRAMTRWHVPVDNVLEALTRKVAKRTVALFGVAHFERDFRNALFLNFSGGDVYLDASTAWPHEGGWHPSWPGFVLAWQSRAATVGGASMSSGERVQITASTTPQFCQILAAWDDPGQVYENVTVTPWHWSSRRAPPEASLHLDGRVKLGVPGDIGKIPATLTWTVSSPHVGTAYAALIADTDRSPKLAARITARDGGLAVPEVTVSAVLPPDRLGHIEHFMSRQRRTVITSRTEATVGIVAEGDTALGALRAAALAIDEMEGSDLIDSAVDWDYLAAQFAAFPSPLEPRRTYRLDGEDSFLSLLVEELRARGMVATVRNGLIAGARLANFSSTETVRAMVTEADLLVDPETHQAVPVEVIDNTQPLASSITFELGDDTEYTWIDSTFQDEFGDGAAIRCTAFKHLPPNASMPAIILSLAALAQQILGPAAEPSRTVRLPLGPTFLHLQPGDLIGLTHARLPTWAGTRGLTEAVCQVMEVRPEIFGSKMRQTVGVRLQSGALSGYAPEALVNAGGLVGGSAVVTLDVASAWGPSCFAKETDASGTAQQDPLDGFAVGDVVVLCEIDNETPLADEQYTLLAVNHLTSQVTLSGIPSAPMIALAAAAYRVVLRFAPWTQVVSRQKAFAFIADAGTGLFSNGEAPKRWAA